MTSMNMKFNIFARRLKLKENTKNMTKYKV